MLLIYNFLSFTALVLYMPWLFFKKGPLNRAQYIRERLGISTYIRSDIWVHAVSVGEVIAALPFIASLQREFPDRKIVFSTTTYTGQKIAREKLHKTERIMYMPWDTWLTVRRTVRALQPKLFITIETELWPALFQRLKRSGCSTVLLNGRISPGSFKGYRLIRPFMKKVLSYLDFVYMQGEADAERIAAIGADTGKTAVMGNFKFDICPDKTGPVEWLDGFDGDIFLAGSTHRGEDEIVLDAYEESKKSVADLRLILAPRHPERFHEVEEILKKRNLNFIRRTKLKAKNADNPPSPPFDKGGMGGLEPPDIMLLDTIGELSQVYSRAAVAFIGGSVMPFGGHNILEPAYYGKPILFGPHMENFPIARDFLNEGAAMMVRNAADISFAIRDLLEHTEKARQMGQNAKDLVDKNTGAVKKAIDLVRSILGTTQ